MNKVLSKEEINAGIKLIDTIATKLDGEVTKAIREEQRFDARSSFKELLKKYPQNTVALMSKLKNLHHFVNEATLLARQPNLFAGTRYDCPDYRKFAYLESSEEFNKLIYDLAEKLAHYEFSRLEDIVYHSNDHGKGWGYKKGNELDRYYKITADLLELILDEDPTNFADEI